MCHLCGSIGPMSSASRYLLRQRHIPYNGPCKPGSQQTRDAETMLGRYWPEIVDGGPTSTQHRINVSCLPGCQIQLEYHDNKLAILTMSTWQCHDQSIRVAPIPMYRQVLTDRQIFIDRKKVNPNLFVIEIKEICTSIYNIGNWLK